MAGIQNTYTILGRSLLAAIVLITGAYALPALIGLLYFGSQGIEWTTGAWSIVAEKLVGRNLGYVLSAMGMVAGIGLYSGLVLVYSRIPFVMARDGFLPKAMMYENKYGAPTVSLLVCGVLFHAFENVSAGFFAMVFFTGLCTASFYGWLPQYLPELFPTRVRATGQGLAFNFGRILAAIGAWQMGALMNFFDKSYAKAGATISLVYLAGMALIWFAPETRGQPLPD